MKFGSSLLRISDCLQFKVTNLLSHLVTAKYTVPITNKMYTKYDSNDIFFLIYMIFLMEILIFTVDKRHFQLKSTDGARWWFVLVLISEIVAELGLFSVFCRRLTFTLAGFLRAFFIIFF